MNIFFTGSTGFIGNEILKSISLNKKSRVICPVRDVYKIKLRLDNIEYIKTTIDESEKIKSFLAEADYIIHAAAELDSKKSDIRIINVEYTRFLLDQANPKLKKFVFFSSTTVKKEYLTEYARTKKEAERLVKKSGLPFLIVRPSWVLGKQSRSFQNFKSYLEKIPVVPVIGSGKTKIQPIYIDDLTGILEKIMFNEEETNKTIEIGGAEPVSYNDFIHYWLKKIGKNNKILFHLPLLFCKFIARKTSILSLDAVSDFEEEALPDISHLKTDYKYQPLGYQEILNKLLENNE